MSLDKCFLYNLNKFLLLKCIHNEKAVFIDKYYNAYIFFWYNYIWNWLFMGIMEKFKSIYLIGVSRSVQQFIYVKSLFEALKI